MEKIEPVSIVVASYKQHQVLGQALSSLLNQIHPVEVIVVTVKSDEETHKLVEEIELRPTVREIISDKADYIYQRNLGIQEASTEYVSFFDSDDWAMPTKISQEMSLARTHDAYLVYSTYIRTDPELNPLILGSMGGKLILDIPMFPPPSYHALLESCYIYDYSLVKKTMYDEFGLFDPELKQAAMYDKWLHILEKYVHKVAFNPHPTFLYRNYPDQMHLTDQQRPEHAVLMNKVRKESLLRYQAGKTSQKWGKM